MQRFHLAARGCRHVKRDPAHAKTVGTVGGKFEFDAGIGQAQIVSQRLADRRIVRQFQQARRIGVDAQFFGRAQHAVGRNAAQFGGLDGDVAHLRADGGQRCQ